MFDSFVYLHSGFYNVEWSVAEDGRGTGDGAEAAGNELGDALGVVAAAVPVLERLHHEETDRLVAALLHHRGRQTLVRSLDSYT